MGYFPSFLFRFLALYFLLNSLHKSDAFQSDTPTESSNHFHVVEVSSLLTANTCSPSSARFSSEEESLKLVHYYGPCSPKNLKYGKANAPSMREILERDQIRVSFMASRLLYGKNNVQVRLGSTLAVGEYVVEVGLGTPKSEFTLLIDTGSSLIWTQCQPCKLGNFQGCYQQRHPIFDPSTSSTYTNIACPSQTCSLANIVLGSSATCDSSRCVYTTGYGGGFRISGFLAKESVSVGSKTFNEIIFGCNEINNQIGVPGNIDGILGLGQNFLSFVEQTAETYEGVFSYCLPSKPSEIGFLKFGKAKQVSKSLKYTELGADYAIQLVGIKLGNTIIPIAAKKAIIDSGTVASAIPPMAYITLREAYRKAMSGYQLAEPFGVFDTCYDIGGHRKIKPPKMSFLFADGLVLDIPPIGVAVPVSPTVVCLPFAVPPPAIEDLVLFGNIQQKTLEVVYDVPGGKLGFGYGGCK